MIAASNASNGYGLYALGYTNSATAGRFAGNVDVTGSFTASSKSFLIDHPSDPLNQYLEHSCVESADRKTVYDGFGVADDSGVLEVVLPPYFEALNRDVRYLLSPVGAPAPTLHVRDELRNGKFVIAGAEPRQKICWLVTGVRNDAYAKAHPIVVEREKAANDNCLFLHPVEHGQPPERGVTYEAEQRARERAAQQGPALDPHGAVRDGGTP